MLFLIVSLFNCDFSCMQTVTYKIVFLCKLCIKLAVHIEKGMLPLKVFLNTNRTKWEFQQKYNLFYLQNDMVTFMFFEYNINN